MKMFVFNRDNNQSHQHIGHHIRDAILSDTGRSNCPVCSHIAFRLHIYLHWSSTRLCLPIGKRYMLNILLKNLRRKMVKNISKTTFLLLLLLFDINDCKTCIYPKTELANRAQVENQGSIARVHGVHRKMLSYIYIMRA